MATSQPRRGNGSARIVVGKFAPTAMVTPSAFRRGRLDTVRTVSAMVPLPRRAVLLKTDSCCLKGIVVCDMPGHKSYSRHHSAALHYWPVCALNKKAPENRGLSQCHLRRCSRLSAIAQYLNPQSPNRGRSPFLAEIWALFIRKLSTKAIS